MDRRHFLGGLSLAATALAMPSIGAAAAPTRRLAGVFPIGFTPINAVGQIDFDGLAAQVKFCRKGGVQGFAWPQIASGWAS
jgi:hypothetical protein